MRAIPLKSAGAGVRCILQKSEVKMNMPGQIPDKLLKRINTERTSDISFRAEPVNVSEFTLRHKISTTAPDSYGTVFLPEGCDFKTRFDKNPMVLWYHGRDESIPKLPIGICVDHSIESSNNEIWAVTKFNDLPFSRELYKLYIDENLRAWSIGFDPVEGIFAGNQEFTDLVNQRGLKGDFDLIFTKWVLNEYSSCPIPSNPEVLSRILSEGTVQDTTLRNCLVRELDQRISPTTKLESEKPEWEIRIDQLLKETLSKDEFDKQSQTIRQLIADVQGTTQKSKGQIQHVLGEIDKLKSQLATRAAEKPLPDFKKLIGDAMAEVTGRLSD